MNSKPARRTSSSINLSSTYLDSAKAELADSRCIRAAIKALACVSVDPRDPPIEAELVDLSPLTGPWPAAVFDPGGYVWRLVIETLDLVNWGRLEPGVARPRDAYSKLFGLLAATWATYIDGTPRAPQEVPLIDSGELDLTRAPTLALLIAVAMLTEQECEAVAKLMQPGRGPVDDGNWNHLYEIVTMTGCSDARCLKMFMEDCTDDAGSVFDARDFELWFAATGPHRAFVRVVREGVRSGSIDRAASVDVVLPTPWPDFDTVVRIPPTEASGPVVARHSVN